VASRIELTPAEGSSLSNSMVQIGGRISKAVNDAMMEQMKLIQRECIASCPVETGALESAIKITNENRRRTWIVYVDESVPDDHGGVVGDYALWLHETTGWKPGKDTIAKLTGNGRPLPGRKYMERPFQDAINNGLIDKIAARAAEITAGRNK
jgi:hypothetical protein